MPLLIGPVTIDTPSINGPCLFPAKAVTSPFKSPNIFVNKKTLEFVHEKLPPDLIAGTPNNPLIPCVSPATPAERKVVVTVNKTVFFNTFLPAVQGDATELVSVPGTKRAFVAPFQHPTLLVANTKK